MHTNGGRSRNCTSGEDASNCTACLSRSKIRSFSSSICENSGTRFYRLISIFPQVCLVSPVTGKVRPSTHLDGFRVYQDLTNHSRANIGPKVCCGGTHFNSQAAKSVRSWNRSDCCRHRFLRMGYLPRGHSDSDRCKALAASASWSVSVRWPLNFRSDELVCSKRWSRRAAANQTGFRSPTDQPISARHYHPHGRTTASGRGDRKMEVSNYCGVPANGGRPGGQTNNKRRW